MSSSPEWLPPQPVSEPAPATPPWEEPREPLLKRIFGPVAVVGVLIAKFAAKLKFLLVALKGAKFLTTSASMLISVAAYTLIWGWRFAVGFVALLFVHEMGHYIQLRREGIRPGGMVFIPFLGAAVTSRPLDNALAEARVGLAGPVLGTLGAAAVAAVAFATDSTFLKALAFTAFFLNLINLVPVVPFDGGRAMAAMAPWMWFLGFGAMVTFLLVFPNPVMILFVLLGGMELYRRWNTRHDDQAYYRVRPAHRMLVGAIYLGLIALLVVGMDATHIVRDFGDV